MKLERYTNEGGCAHEFYDNQKYRRNSTASEAQHARVRHQTRKKEARLGLRLRTSHGFIWSASACHISTKHTRYPVLRVASGPLIESPPRSRAHSERRNHRHHPPFPAPPLLASRPPHVVQPPPRGEAARPASPCRGIGPHSCHLHHWLQSATPPTRNRGDRPEGRMQWKSRGRRAAQPRAHARVDPSGPAPFCQNTRTVQRERVSTQGQRTVGGKGGEASSGIWSDSCSRW